MDFVSFKTPDGKIHTFPKVFASQAQKMLEDYWVPQYYQYVSESINWPEGMAKGRVVEITK